MEVQRVRVVDNWAVKTGQGQYLDRHAVNVVNTLIIVLLVGAAAGWLFQAWALFGAVAYTYGPNPQYWYWSSVGGSLIGMVYRLVVALVTLAGVKLIIEHNRHTALVIAVLSGVFFVVSFLAGSVTDVQFATGGAYLIIGFLAVLTGKYYR